eukprot:CAMPEP_0203663646 /NCGR_PEP_ID=MMETSP0090-20130426/1210_1 /ASSEMBLY_ACC=CAM_ASM_001088 /TAXON_ID=426623 /ORGANISM="Chaetoceros affinis, Strain CCMP159" /LENGTH=812 /DNA_ID=CAMNT_0050526637 /DNA_START=17 /DNA_END=2452 /DNA_ORIENTATION=+
MSDNPKTDDMSENNTLLIPSDDGGTKISHRRVKSHSSGFIISNSTADKKELMGPILRKKKVISLPIGDRTFFTLHEEGEEEEQSTLEQNVVASSLSPQDEIFLQRNRRQRQPSLPERLIRRKQVSLDMFGPQDSIDFFGGIIPEEDIGALSEEEEEEYNRTSKLFFPLRFSPRPASKTIQEHKKEKIVDEEGRDNHTAKIIKATTYDKIKAGILFCIMIAFLGVCIGWKTHSNESNYIFGPVGIACVTPCNGSERNFFDGHHDQFHNGDVISIVSHIDPRPDDAEEENFKNNYAVIDIIRLDRDSEGKEVQTIVRTEKIGPPNVENRKSENIKVTVSWDDPTKHHLINITSSVAEYPMSLNLMAMKEISLSQQSVLIAALIMILVYLFILLEWIHRTLVAIFGSMVALFFFFLMHGSETESIRTVMLHQEWSTLGLLFGMMLIVGELSHTGIFEWFAVRLLVSSKGSFRRLLMLLSLLTAITSAFLDNVTTMLLLAPVTIDMCNILQVDPRPYLISEVILSNIGGTATLIGDPPNIIIGSSFDEVGFVDFIVNIMPCIFIIATPTALIIMVLIYSPYMTMKKMAVLDAEKLKETYPIYDEPRLLIAGTTTFFVILLFFLHPLHHKDTAWIALIGAFLTIAFTNPHDVQDALRNHVEWDTLLFFAGLFVLVEVCADMGLLEAIGGALANVIRNQDENQQLSIAITLILWVSAITSAFLDNIPYTATMIPVVRILHEELPDTLPIKTLVWALSFGACLGGNGTLLGASANIVTAGIASGKGFNISFMNFFYPGMVATIVTTAIANLYMLVIYVW